MINRNVLRIVVDHDWALVGGATRPFCVEMPFGDMDLAKLTLKLDSPAQERLHYTRTAQRA